MLHVLGSIFIQEDGSASSPRCDSRGSPEEIKTLAVKSNPRHTGGDDGRDQHVSGPLRKPTVVAWLFLILFPPSMIAGQSVPGDRQSDMRHISIRVFFTHSAHASFMLLH